MKAAKKAAKQSVSPESIIAERLKILKSAQFGIILRRKKNNTFWITDASKLEVAEVERNNERTLKYVYRAAGKKYIFFLEDIIGTEQNSISLASDFDLSSYIN